MALDLHLHSTASDGQHEPSHLVNMAADAGLSGIALTDHDTVDGNLEAEHRAVEIGLSFIPGVELSTDWFGKEVHILGYGIDYRNSKLLDRLFELRSSRILRAKKMIEKLNHLGLNISWTKLKDTAGDAAVGRPHVAIALLKSGYVKSVKEAFDLWIGYKKPGYVPREKISPIEAVKLLLRAGAVPVMAHPGLTGEDSLIQKLVGCGLEGIEAFYPEHSEEQRDKYISLAQHYNLVITGGSDFHGETIKSEITIGCCTVDDEVMEKLK